MSRRSGALLGEHLSAPEPAPRIIVSRAPGTCALCEAPFIAGVHVIEWRGHGHAHIGCGSHVEGWALA